MSGKKLKVLIIFFLWLLIVLPSPLDSYERGRIGNRFDLMIHSGIDMVQKGDYDEAIGVFQKMIEKDPESPVGYFYIAATYESMMQDFKNRSFHKEFDFFIDKAIEKGEELLDEVKDDGWLYFYLGGSYGYRAIDRSETGKWFGAFTSAVKGAAHLEKAVSIDPELYDAYYGLGVYKYWRSVKLKVLWFLPFFEDERQAGIDDIWLSIRKGKYCKYEAMNSLIRIYRNEKDYKNALDMAEVVLEKYPENFNALRMAGVLYIDLQKWDKAYQAFDKLSEQLKKNRWKTVETDFELEYYRTYIQLKKQNIEECIVGCVKLVKYREEIDQDVKSDEMLALKKKVDELCPVDFLLQFEESKIKNLK
jgi:tetratricopeptide (TPR) repeat protein